MTTPSPPTLCHAVAWHANGRIAGMSQPGSCRFKATRNVTHDGTTYPICGVHAAALRTTYRGGRGGRVSFGIRVVSDRREARSGQLTRIEADTPTQPLEA
jgi:hypothetical protein